MVTAPKRPCHRPSADGEGVANFRVSVAGSFHDWLLTHLSLGFVRMKTVTIRGEKLTRKA